MLYRRHLRIKALQSLYEWYSGSYTNLPDGERELIKSINKLYNLFIYQLSFLVEVKKFALIRMEENKKKFYPTKEDLNPNLKFINNKVLKLIEENQDFKRKEEALKINWSQEQEMILKFYHILKEAPFFKKYMADSNFSLEEEKKFVIKVIDRLMMDFDLLRSYYDEKDIYYAEGYDLVGILLVKFIDSINSRFTENSRLPGIYNTSGKKINEDELFVRTLYRKVILNDEKYSKIIAGKTKNWDYERIPLTDLIIIKLAIAELQEMPTIPVKVTLNEYIELAKYFSTQKSKIFINGILDKLISEFKEEGIIKKQGRGLKE